MPVAILPGNTRTDELLGGAVGSRQSSIIQAKALFLKSVATLARAWFVASSDVFSAVWRRQLHREWSLRSKAKSRRKWSR